jgi:hypothetical protein
VDTGTGETLARYVKAKNEADDRIGCLETRMNLHGAATKALTVLMLCALLQAKRLKSKGKKHSRGDCVGIIIAGVLMLKANDLV